MAAEQGYGPYGLVAGLRDHPKLAGFSFGPILVKPDLSPEGWRNGWGKLQDHLLVLINDDPGSVRPTVSANSLQG